MYESQNTIIAKIEGTTRTVSLYDVDDGRFEDRLQLDNQTGSLTISDIRTKHSGDYYIKIISTETLVNTFSVTVHDVIFAGLENKREGESVTLYTGFTDSHKHDLMRWTFGPLNPDTFTAEMNVKIHQITYSSDHLYKDRLHLENQTGSLTIRDVRTADAGVYQLQISNSKETLYKRFNVFVAVPDPGLSTGYIVLICVCVLLFVASALGVIYYYMFRYSKRKEKKTLSVIEGSSVTLKTGAAEIQRGDEVRWMFGPQNDVIAQIDKKDGNILYTGNVHFRDKLQLDQQTGDLTISDIRIRISGDYCLEITRSRATKMKRFKVIVRVDTLKFTEGETVHLTTGVTEIQKDDLILWKFEPKNAVIAKVDGKTHNTSIDDEGFRDRLEVDSRTGNLTITNIKSIDSGVYEVEIKSSNKVSYKKFNVLVWMNTLKYTVGDAVTLQTGVTELTDDRILWKFSDKETIIAELIRATSKALFYEGPDGRFRDRLQINQRTGDLTIRNISRAHSDVYTLQITSGKKITCKRFVVIAHGGCFHNNDMICYAFFLYVVLEQNKEKTVSEMEGDLVVLDNDIEIQDDDQILWLFGAEDRLIAKGERNKDFCTYDGAEGKFKNTLNLDHQTGSLILTNSTSEHTGVYKLLIVSSRETKYKRFKVMIRGE
ncbi:hypothetical protein DPX16_1228 [Anabarilius grahami]|uniref:Immunoglobulin domain-containing protein n=1 Tax=Anabarilius grahami TaxID=495550 RepID=A0A3N0XPR9_ANAGA|nr:hypothetical protein DPX16_1228 [Anabarilius grahami]